MTWAPNRRYQDLRDAVAILSRAEDEAAAGGVPAWTFLGHARIYLQEQMSAIEQPILDQESFECDCGAEFATLAEAENHQSEHYDPRDRAAAHYTTAIEGRPH